VSSKWGREESYRWPSKKPVWTITALFVAALATMATVFYVYAEEWTFLQQRYLGTYITSVSRPWVKVAPYRMVFRVDGAKERLAVDADFNDPVVLARKAKLQWEEKRYASADVERWLRETIYGGATPWQLLFDTPWKVGAGVLVLGLFFAIPLDQQPTAHHFGLGQHL
jgi:hypothetical protein